MIDNDRYTPNLDLFDALKSKDSGNMTIGDLKESPSSLISSAIKVAAKDPEIDVATYGKYSKYGVRFDWDRYISGELDYALWKNQSAWNQFTNALGQTFVSEIGLGTVKAFSDLSDIIIGEAFKGDNDYSNPFSLKLEEWQEQYKNNHPIYTDPTRPVGHGAMGDFGWWMTNLPSIASSLTLFVPGLGVGKVASIIGKTAGKGLRAATKYARTSGNALRRARGMEEASKVGRFENWLNRPNVGTMSNRIIENSATALAMRNIENYQESRQVYNDMMKQVIDSWNEMNDAEKQDFIDRNADLFAKNGVDTSNIQDMAKAIAKQSADLTYQIDMANLLWDILQVATIGNPIKLPKSLRTTRKINKAQREAKIYAQFGTTEGAKKLAERSILKKTADYFSDLGKSRWLLTAELSEGVEEAVNYIAQQEGMHFGNVMLDATKESIFADRLNSYMRSPELYEAAFWGVLGGVVFQGGSSQIKRAIGATVESIKENKKYNADTKEGNKITWRQAFETAENKKRVAEIDSRYEALTNLQKKHKEIFEQGISPFKNDIDEKGKRKKLNTETEKQAAWSRAVDDYIAKQYFSAVEAGNYDLLKDYLRDPAVKEILTKLDGTIDIEQVISRMEHIDKIYSDELIKVNSLLSNVNADSDENEKVTEEYISIIAKDNAASKLAIERLNKDIAAYEQSAEANKVRFNISDTEALSYKNGVELLVATNTLKSLRQRVQEIKNDKTYAASLNGQIELNTLNSRIKSINQYVRELKPTVYSDNITSFLNTLTSTFLSLDEESDEYLDLFKAISNQDIESINKVIGQDFKLSDEEIIKIFGEPGTDSGSFYTFNEELKEHFSQEVDSRTGEIKKQAQFREKAPNLQDDYEVLAAKNIAKFFQQAGIANNRESIMHSVNMLHNIMNTARKRAIKQASDTIVELSKKYGKDAMLSYIFDNVPIPNITDEDKAKLDSALAVLNLANPDNEALRTMIIQQVLLGDYKQKVDDNPTDSEDTDEEDDTPEPDTEKQIQISFDANSSLGITTSFVEKSDTNNKTTTFDYVETEDNNRTVYELVFPKLTQDELKQVTQLTSKLFDGYDENNTNEIEVVKTPKISFDENNNLQLEEKGEIRYKQPTTKPTSQPTPTPAQSAQPTPPPISSTGGEEQTKPTSTQTIDEEEGSDDTDINQRSPEEEELLEQQNGATRYIAQQATIFAIQNKNLNDEERQSKFEEKVKEIRQEINEKFPRVDSDLINQQLQRFTDFINDKYKFNLMLAIEHVTSRYSTVTENAEPIIDEAFADASKNLLDEYIAIANVPKYNGKHYINFEDFLRHVTNFLGKDKAEQLYPILRAYFSSTYNKEFVLTDNPNSPDILDNAAKSEEQRLTERIGELDKYRVHIDYLFDGTHGNNVTAFYGLNVGDKLNLKKVYVGGNLHIILVNDKGVEVGDLAIPELNSDNTRFTIFNRDWFYAIPIDGSKSSLQTYFENLAGDEEANALIYKLLYDNLDDSDREKATQELFELLLTKNINGYKGGDYINPVDTRINQVVEHVLNLWRYKATAQDFNLPPADRQAYISAFLPRYFKKIHSTYEALAKLSDALEVNDNLQVTIANINDGEIVRNIELDNEKAAKSRDNYYSFTQSNQAFPDSLDVRLGVVSEQGVLLLENNETKQHDKFGSKGTPHIVIPNRNGKPNFCIATSVSVIDSQLDKNSDAYAIIKAAKEWIDRAVNVSDEQLLNTIVDVASKLMKTKGGVGLFYGVDVNTNSPTYAIFLKKKLGNREYTFSINKNGEFIYKEKGKSNVEQTGNIADNRELVKQTLENFLSYCKFNANFDLFNKHERHDGCIGYENGKFVISVGDKLFTYNNVSEAFIKGGLLRVNTHVNEETGTNYRRKGNNQGGNQILEIDSNIITSPVEENDDNNSSQQTNTTKDILAQEDNVDKLIEKAFENAAPAEKKSLKELKNSGLLPKSVIFVEKLNDSAGEDAVAETNTTTREVRVSNAWVDLYDGRVINSETGELYGENVRDSLRKQAIRKLVHEQVHLKVADYGRTRLVKQLTPIYEEFKKYITNADDTIKERFNKYLFSDKPNDEERIEEFFVESITSQELCQLLNTIQADYTNVEIDEEKAKIETLWQKILKLIAKVFNYLSYRKDGRPNAKFDIKSESLLQKEIYALQNALIYKEDNTAQQSNPPDNDYIDFGEDINLDSSDGQTVNSTIVEPVDLNQVEQVRAFEQELQDIKAQAIADGTFMKAPNGNSTNLNKRQWLQVRTKAFKDWFGDWESVAARIANAKVIWGHPGIGKTEYYKNNNNVIDFDSVYKPRINKELGLPEGAEERKKWRREHRDEYRQKILSLFDEAVEDAKKQGKQLLVSDMVVLQEREDALDLITQMSEDTFAKRSVQRNEAYDDNKKLWKTDIDESISKVSDKSKVVNTEKYLSELYEDAKDVSKVVDENGEPLVVYHGSDDVFTIFDIDKFGKTDQGDLGRGFYFAYRKDTAKQYGNNIQEVFLNIRNPFIHKGESTQNIVIGFNREYNPTIKEKLNKTITALEHKIELYKEQLSANNSVERISLLNKNINYYSTLVNNYKEELRTRKDLDEKSFDTLKDYDGVIEETKSYQLVVKNPNQIKSATDNIGTYSNEDNDIRHSSVVETAQTYTSAIALLHSVSSSQQPELARFLATGEISMRCR